MRELETLVRLKFLEFSTLESIRQNQDDYIFIRYHPESCFVKKTCNVHGEQELFIADWGESYDIMHEICHKLGLEHEMQRDDATSCNTIAVTNMDNMGQMQYKEDKAVMGVGPFDFFSIMQYPQCNGFSITDEPCHVEGIKADANLLAKYRDGEAKGKNVRMSPGDIRTLILIYGHPEHVIAQSDSSQFKMDQTFQVVQTRNHDAQTLFYQVLITEDRCFGRMSAQLGLEECDIDGESLVKWDQVISFILRFSNGNQIKVMLNYFVDHKMEVRKLYGFWMDCNGEGEGLWHAYA